jgi:hypothetical protein
MVSSSDRKKRLITRNEKRVKVLEDQISSLKHQWASPSV